MLRYSLFGSGVVPINSTEPSLQAGAFTGELAYQLSEEQKHFLKYGNELCALLVGFLIALNYELQANEEQLRAAGEYTDVGQRLASVREVRLSRRFVFEYPQLLKHKNFSWHALYMVYHSLFERFERKT